MAEPLAEHSRTDGSARQAALQLENVGRLAGAIAHDFNNLLTVILGFSEVLLEDVAPGDTRRADLEAIRHAAQTGASLTRHLLAFSRQQVLRPQVLDLNDIVRGMQPILRRLLGVRITIRVRCAASPAFVQADETELEQVLLNLAINARDAMPDGGTLTFDTDADSDGLPGAPAGAVRLLVSDTGTGMTADVAAHIFEPFFTTKSHGQGTGMGLSTVHGIVKQRGGDISVSSTPGAGTCFTLVLPQVVVEGPSPRPAPRVVSIADVLGRARVE